MERSVQLMSEYGDSSSTNQPSSEPTVETPRLPLACQSEFKPLVITEAQEICLPPRPSPSSAISNPKQLQPQKQPSVSQPQLQPVAKRHTHRTRPKSASRVKTSPAGIADECVPRRTITNRQSAMRSKERQRKYVSGLEQSVKEFTMQLAQQQDHLHTIETHSNALGLANEGTARQLAAIHSEMKDHMVKLTASLSECARLRMSAQHSNSYQCLGPQVDDAIVEVCEPEAAAASELSRGSLQLGTCQLSTEDKAAAAAISVRGQAHTLQQPSAHATCQEANEQLPIQHSCPWESFLQWDDDALGASSALNGSAHRGQAGIAAPVFTEASAAQNPSFPLSGPPAYGKSQGVLIRSGGSRAEPVVSSMAAAAREGSVVPQGSHYATTPSMSNVRPLLPCLVPIHLGPSLEA